jgi:modulator of FtsH protease
MQAFIGDRDMNDRIQTAEYYDVLSSEDRNRVLRNTYWVLAVSMLPTVLGAWV